MLSGVAAGIAGMLLAARTGSGQPDSGIQGLELEAITAAVLGGCALQGGKGTIVGALLGVLIIGVLNNGMILTGVPTFYQLLAKGALLILAVMIQERQLRRAGESMTGPGVARREFIATWCAGWASASSRAPGRRADAAERGRTCASASRSAGPRCARRSASSPPRA